MTPEELLRNELAIQEDRAGRAEEQVKLLQGRLDNRDAEVGVLKRVIDDLEQDIADIAKAADRALTHSLSNKARPVVVPSLPSPHRGPEPIRRKRLFGWRGPFGQSGPTVSA